MSSPVAELNRAQAGAAHAYTPARSSQLNAYSMTPPPVAGREPNGNSKVIHIGRTAARSSNPRQVNYSHAKHAARKSEQNRQVASRLADPQVKY